jgi:hypothetical protein
MYCCVSWKLRNIREKSFDGTSTWVSRGDRLDTAALVLSLKYVLCFEQITVITHLAAEAFSQGFFNSVPIMTGLTSEEQAYFLPETNSHVPLTADDFNAYAASFGRVHASVC